MGPIELFFIGIGAVITLVGVARGYAKELGVTLVVMSTIFLLTFAQQRFDDSLRVALEGLLGADDPAAIDFVLGTIYSVVFISIVFASYAGVTLEFRGKERPEPGRTLISLLIGLLNGYLIAGTLWYYQDFYGYPMSRWVPIEQEFSALAQTMIELLPPTLFDNPTFWIIPVAILLILRVRG